MAPKSERPGVGRPSWRVSAPLLAALSFGTACSPAAKEDAPDENDGGLGSTSSPAATDAGMPKRAPELLALRYDDGPPPADPSNRFADDPLALQLGQRLFFDRSLSGPLIEGDNDGSGGTLGLKGEAGKVSCADCHVPESGFVDTRSPHRQISLAAQWTQRRSPTLLDIAFAPLYNWDGRRDSIWAQAAGVIESDREFNSSRLYVSRVVGERYAAEYEALFGPLPDLEDTSRFPPLSSEDNGCRELTSISGVEYDCRGKPGDGAEYDGMSPADQRAVTQVMVDVTKAMAAYVRALRCGEAPFDRWLDGDDTAISESAVRGAELFVGKADCVRCHSGPSLTDGAFHNVGLQPAVVAVAFIDSNDRGAAAALPELSSDPLNSRGEFSDGERDVDFGQSGEALEGAFRTPSLRCIASQPSFMHTGQFKTLSGVIGFFADGGRPQGYPGQNELEPLELSEEERADLILFIESLNGPGPDSALLEEP
jgi:cytochrome c peroxidase